LQIPGTIVFHGYHYKDDIADDFSKGRDLTFKLMLYELMLTVLIIPGLFFMKNNPKTPPSGFANTNV
jgi:FLVCR family feline leukemia virus subgroup C receptor-related protein